MYIIREIDKMIKRYIHMFKPHAAVKKDEEPKIQVFFQQFPPSKACPMHKNKCSFFSLQYLFSPVIKAPCDSLSYLQPNVNIHAVDPPLPLSQQVTQPLDPQASPLVAQHSNLLRSGASSGFRCRIDHVDEGVVEGEGECMRVLIVDGEREGRRRSREEPVAAEVEEAAVGPVARGEEEDEEEDGAVDAGAVEEVGADEEEEDEGGRGVCRDEEEWEPASEAKHGC